jgi:Ca2+-binding RTX toxin-like protein
MATIIGTEGPDALTDGSGADTIQALGGDDTIVLDSPTAGADVVDGGDGIDRLVVDGRLAPSFIRVSAGGSGPSYSGTGFNGDSFTFAGIEHFTAYHNPNTINGDGITTGGGDDVYHYTVKNDASFHFIRYTSFVDLGGGSNDRIVIDGSAVGYGLQNIVDPNQPSHMRLRINGSPRIDYWNVEQVEFIGGSAGDTIVGVGGNDILDGRYGDDSISGAGGDDRLIGGEGNDTLDGGEGNDTLVFTAGDDTAAGGEGIDRLEIDSRATAAGLVLGIVPGGATYSGNFSYAGGSVGFSGIESFTVYSNPGDFADDVTTQSGDDIFHHYGINSLSYAMDHVNLGDGGVDLLVADFSTVTDFAVANGLYPTLANFYQFTVGGNVKIRYTNVERIHFVGGGQGDSVTGLAGDDILDGRVGNDSLSGGAGDDDIAGGTGTNSIDAGDDDDIVRSVGFAIDTVQGGAGFDTAIIDYSAQTAAIANIAGGDIAFGNGGDTSVTLTGVERFLIATGSGNDSISTLGGDDEIRTGAGSDIIVAGAGNDRLDGGSGADSMTGGSGDDIYVVDDSGDTVTEASGEGTDTVHASVAAYVLAANAENLVAAGAIAHSLRGNSLDNVVRGEAGNDLILLQDGGADAGYGLWGDDVVYFGSAYTAADRAEGGAGRDAFVLQGNYTVTLSGTNVAGFESVSLQSGANANFGDTAGNYYDYAITASNDLVAAGVQLIVNAQSLRAGEDFRFDGSAETDGRFLVYGGHGVDDLVGGAGVDVFFFEGTRWGQGDKVDGGGGRDALVISGGNGITHIEFAADSITSIESISLNKRFATDPSQKPSYDLILHNGNVAPGGTLIVNGSSIPGGQVVGIDGRAVHDGNLILFGGGGHDTLFGGLGADLMIGGAGADGLTGGAGADTFRYDSASDSVAGLSDLIGDFVSGTDKFDLTRVDANANAAGDQAFTWIGSNAFSGTAGELRSFEQGGYRWVEGDTDGDGDGDLVIALQPGAPLVQTDFLL